MKKLICLLLALAAIVTLAAGCGKELNPNPEPTSALTPEALNDIAGGQDPNSMDAAALKALQDKLASGGYIPEGVTIPAEVPPPVTMPPPMPTGVAAKAEDVIPLVENVIRILSSETYLIKARGASPLGDGSAAIGSTPITFAVDKGLTAFELDVDWINMYKVMSEGTAEYGLSTIKGAASQTMFGRKLRFISKADGASIVFVDKKTYMAMPSEGAAAVGENSTADMAGSLSKVFTPQKGDIIPSKVTDGGKEYLCATITGPEGTIMRYYFLDGSLRRIEMEGQMDESMAADQVMVFEIEQLSNTVDPAMFNTAGFTAMPIDQLSALGDSFGGVFSAGA